ncbi:MAG: cobalamin-dependent protein [Acidimicrobiales bacterium]
MKGRVLVAKPGLDGHDRGAKVVAYALRDAGFEVIYTGIRQRTADIVTVAVQEDVDVIGLSVLSGSHVELTEDIHWQLVAMDAEEIPIVVGGAIPRSDLERLLQVGATAVFPTGSVLDDVVGTVGQLCAQRMASR